MLLPPINLRSHVNSSVVHRLSQVILAGICVALMSHVISGVVHCLPQVILRITGRCTNPRPQLTPVILAYPGCGLAAMRALFKQTVCSGKTLPRSLPRSYTMSFVSQRSSQGGSAKRRASSQSRSRSRGPPTSRGSSVMSQGGVPGGGVVKLMKQIPSVECKFHDTQLITGTFPVGWTDISTQAGPISPYSDIQQGPGPSQRIGRKIRVIGIVVRLVAVAGGTPLAFDLVNDKQCNGVSATAAQVYLTPADPSSFPNPFEDTRFQFLKRVQNNNYCLTAPTAAASEFVVSYTVKCNKVVEYNGAGTGTVVDLTSDNLTLFACAMSTGGVLQKIASGQIRVLYVDS